MNIRAFANKILSNEVKITLKSYYLCFIMNRKKSKDRKNVFLLITPAHCNLGDHAIAASEYEFLCDYNVIEITGEDLSVMIKRPRVLKRLIGDSPLFLNGGGYLGTLWYSTELLVRRLMNLFKDNLIIVFPQTIFYEDDADGRKKRDDSVEIYNNCKRLYICAREKTSYELMKTLYKNVILVPDMVLRLNESKSSVSRKGAMMLLRNDIEKTLNDDFSENICNLLKRNFDDVTFSDMCLSRNVSPSERKEALDEKFSEIRSKELVVTDRLHGMIFSAITGTPCVVVNSKSPKVKGVYDFVFSQCPYIFFTEDLDDIEDFISKMKNKEFLYDNCGLKPYYDKLKNLIDGEIGLE